MQDNTFKITGYGSYDDSVQGTRQTVQFDYQVNGQVYSTEHFLDVYGNPPTADNLNTGLQNWLTNEATPQLVPPAPVVPQDLTDLIDTSQVV